MKLTEEQRALIDSAETMEDLEKIKQQLEEAENNIKAKADEQDENNENETQTKDLESSKDEENKTNVSKDEERSMIRETEKLEERSIENVVEIKEDKKMEQKFTVKSPEYRNAWAKTMMGLELNDIEKRAVGDAVGTTATEFVQANASTNGINNLGLLIPDSLRQDLLDIIEQQSPIYRDITKLNINGNIDLPYLFSADDAEWYAETINTKNEGQEYRSLKLTGYELAKDVEITWKAEAMTVDGFMNFLVQELNKKMNTALINAIIYGDGSNKPTGITNGVTAKEGTAVIDVIKEVLGTLSDEDRIGAKVYVSSAVADEITFYKDANGNYPYLVAGLGNANGVRIETDPYLKDKDIVAGNMKNYILNFNQGLRIDREIQVKPRRVIYGGYVVVDGNKKPNSMAYGKLTTSV